MNKVRIWIGMFVADRLGFQGGYLFYRCKSCGKALAAIDVQTGSCPRCKGAMINPTNLSFKEELQMIIRSFFNKGGKYAR